jgi:hypothetical protein
VLLLSTWYLASRHYRRRWAIATVGLLMGVVVTLTIAGLNLGAIIFSNSLPTTNVARYGELRAQMGNSPDNHFPEQIPADAEHVWFYYRPGLLQGRTDLQLRLQLPAERISEVQKKYEGIAVDHRVGPRAREGEDCQKAFFAPGPCAVPPSCFRLPRLYATGGEPAEFSQEYEFFVLGAVAANPSTCWNHGDTWGVAVNRAEAQVVYWASSW